MLLQRPLLAATAVVLTTAGLLLAVRSTGDAAGVPTGGDATPARRSAGSALPPTAVGSAVEQARSIAPVGVAAPAAGPARLVVTAPQKLLVGETGELVVALDTPHAVGEIGFTVRFDPNVLQVRAGTEGDWATAATGTARFAVDVSDGEDQVRIRAAVGAGATGARGSIALIHFQAVAAGSTAVMVSDVSVNDPTGRALPFGLSPSNLQLTAESAPATPAPRRAGAPAAEPPPAEETAEQGD